MIPITSLDAGLVFERDLEASANMPLTQTLEPRAYYVYVPYRKQNNAPVFDTALDDFNFSQLFIRQSLHRQRSHRRREPADDGADVTVPRSGDTGGERLRLAVGQRFYFEDQRVNAERAAAFGVDIGLSASAEGRLSDAWALAACCSTTWTRRQIERLNAGFRYTPAIGHAFNAT